MSPAPIFPSDESFISDAAGTAHVPAGRGWRGFVIALLAGLLLLCAASWTVSMYRGLGSLQDAVSIRADRYAATLESTLQRYEYLPELISLHPFVRDLLDAPDNPARLAAANDYLAEVNARANASATYLIANSGIAVAASNHDQANSFIGFDYRFRPYFQRAAAGEIGRFYAIGITADEPGYYISHPVKDGASVVGVVAVKLSLEWFQQAGAGGDEPVTVSDEHGVLFLSTVPAWRYQSLQPLSASTQKLLERTRQYHGKAIRPLPLVAPQSFVMRWVGRLVLGDDAQLVNIGNGGRSEGYLMVSRKVGPADWSMEVMTALDPVLAGARNATLAAALAYACACLVLLNLRLRRQRQRDIEYGRSLLEAAYDELERRVGERTADLMAINERLQAEVRERTRAESDLRAAQDELVQTSKLAALGQMAAGITHELNQPLAALRTFSDNTRLLLERGKLDAARDNLGAIADLTARMGRITGQLRLFAGKARPAQRAVPVRTAIEHALALLAPRLKDVALRVGFPAAPPEPTVRADEIKLEQVLLNLIGNALDALNDGAPAAPTIEIDVARSEGKLCIAVRDNGAGIPADVLPKLFEPFFTTKETGRGLGLGLAISASIVRECGGHLSAANRPQGGAEFLVVLPASGD